MARLRYNGVRATLGADLLTADTTITFTSKLTHAAGDVPTISGSDYLPLYILDANGLPLEIVHLTAYATGATTGTVTRAQESTTAADHTSGLTVEHGLTVADATEFSGGAAAGISSAALASDYALTSTLAPIGVSLTAAAAGDYLVSASVDMDVASADTFAYAEIQKNGTGLGPVVWGKGGETGARRITVTSTQKVTCAASDVVRIAAVRTGSGSSFARSTHTTLTLLGPF